jgi:CsoR family transcriptional regulator, copper-sensing transcriptional repressor
MRAETKRGVGDRLRRVEGQVRGIARMIEEDRYCIDVLTQLRAVHAALRRVEEEVLRDHVEHCVARAMATGDDGLRRQTVQELVDALRHREG